MINARGFSYVAALSILSIVAGALLRGCTQPAQGQEANSVPLVATAAIADTGIPIYATDPGTEGAVRMDGQRIYTFHAGLWGWSPRFAMPAKPTNTQ